MEAALINGTHLLMCITTQSIRQAHDGLQPGRLALNAGELLDANINRSPTAYEANPAGERARFRHDTDKRMVQLGLLGSDGRCGAALQLVCRFESDQRQTWAQDLK